MRNFFSIKPTGTNFPNLLLSRNLRISGSSFDHHQEFSTVHSALVYVIKPLWHIPVPNVQWKTPDDGRRNYAKHVEFLDKSKFGTLVRLLVLLKRNLLRCAVTWTYLAFFCQWKKPIACVWHTHHTHLFVTTVKKQRQLCQLRTKHIKPFFSGNFGFCYFEETQKIQPSYLPKLNKLSFHSSYWKCGMDYTRPPKNCSTGSITRLCISRRVKIPDPSPLYVPSAIKIKNRVFCPQSECICGFRMIPILNCLCEWNVRNTGEGGYVIMYL
jgi:hypothetical protein